jgi:hypothetical protein
MLSIKYSKKRVVCLYVQLVSMCLRPLHVPLRPHHPSHVWCTK